MSETTARLYTAAQVRALDAWAMERLERSGVLMQRAGAAALDAASSHFSQARRWLVLAGGGNNGGDGYVVARLAAGRGIDVSVCALSDPGRLGGDAAEAYRAWRDSGGSVARWPAGNGHDLVIDAMLGTGLDRAVEGDYRAAIEWLNDREVPVVAVDLPSGLDADTGQVWGVATRAAVTVTFVGRKRGLYTGVGPDHAGTVVFHDLAIGEPPADLRTGSGTLVDRASLARWLAPRPRAAHKGDHGHVLVIGGSPGMSGAARLAGEGALRSGAGLVTVATHPDHARLLNIARPELMVTAVAEAAGLEPLLERADVVAVGPGLGQGAWGREMLAAARASGLPLVVDADGLNVLAATTDGGLPPGSVITPHPGEAARLLGSDSGTVQDDRFAAATALAARWQAVTVLKGRGSVIADTGGEWALCPLGNPGMASGGTGDVLTGVIAALRGQGLDAWAAACCGTAAHAAAGDLAAERLGERGLVAGDLAGHLPLVLNPR